MEAASADPSKTTQIFNGEKEEARRVCSGADEGPEHAERNESGTYDNQAESQYGPVTPHININTSDDTAGYDASSNETCSLESEFQRPDDDKVKILQEEIELLKRELATKNQQLSVMKTFQTDASMEIEELTSALFTEAYQMVDKEKKLTALKEKECAQLRKQLQELSLGGHRQREGIRPHALSEEAVNLVTQNGNDENKESRSVLGLLRKNFRKKQHLPSEVTVLVDPFLYQEFRHWLMTGKRQKSARFFSTLVETDMLPSLCFQTRKDPHILYSAICNGEIELKSLGNEGTSSSLQSVKCALCPDISGVEYRLKLSRMGSEWEHISAFAGNRIKTVIDLYHYLITEDFTGREYQHVYKQLIMRRRAVYLARIGYPS